ncbi:MAG: hypothetical protein ACE5ED_07790 [Rhodothalassiaceae bacterium]
MTPLLSLLFLLAAAGPPHADAAPVPACDAAHEGQLSCQANRVCECVFSRAVPARHLPDRWHWDCGIERPACSVTRESLAPHATPAVPYIVDVEHGRQKKKEDEENSPPR